MKQLITLIAEDGKVLTNGTDYAKSIRLAEGVNPNNYYEITEEKYQEILAIQEKWNIGDNNE